MTAIMSFNHERKIKTMLASVADWQAETQSNVSAVSVAARPPLINSIACCCCQLSKDAIHTMAYGDCAFEYSLERVQILSDKTTHHYSLLLFTRLATS